MRAAISATRATWFVQSRRFAMKTDQLSEEIQYSDPNAPSPEMRLLTEEREAVLQDCLQRLGDRMAALVKARLTGDDYDEICTRLDINPGQIYKLFHQAKTTLTTCVERTLP